ncbi:hypothetical protein [Anaerospora sp.]|uniref:hypothetical protein n=1 Tax=Anaerospora sp. TaxID=1960278 RepID=UPI00289A919C|nr:hypothetical protein [Anaerospora sp.]
MNEDDFLLEAAGWAGYYENANEIIRQIAAANVAEAPSREIMNNPQEFHDWVEQCKQIHAARNR